jgi:H/ACA ribonucleoprotein complex non-core subunit NAF1
MADFKVPQSIPQDILLIHDIIGVTNETPLPSSQKLALATTLTEDSIDSSDDDNNASEEEIEADLIFTEENEIPKAMHISQLF